MNTRRLLSLLVIAILTLVPSFLLTGCEDEDSPDTGDLDSYFADHPYVSDPRNSEFPRLVSISPSSALISFVGEQVAFTASGGRGEYTWDVGDGSKGSINRTGGDAATYTASVVGPNDVIVYDSEGNAAVATINGPSTVLVATANPTELAADGDVAVVTAGGGIPPYTWDVGDIALGFVSPSTGSSTVYTRSAPVSGDNTVTVHDSSGNTYTVLISQP
jgi:hypothetical protein